MGSGILEVSAVDFQELLRCDNAVCHHADVVKINELRSGFIAERQRLISQHRDFHNVDAEAHSSMENSYRNMLVAATFLYRLQTPTPRASPDQLPRGKSLTAHLLMPSIASSAASFAKLVHETFEHLKAAVVALWSAVEAAENMVRTRNSAIVARINQRQDTCFLDLFFDLVRAMAVYVRKLWFQADAPYASMACQTDTEKLTLEPMDTMIESAVASLEQTRASIASVAICLFERYGQKTRLMRRCWHCPEQSGKTEDESMDLTYAHWENGLFLKLLSFGEKYISELHANTPKAKGQYHASHDLLEQIILPKTVAITDAWSDKSQSCCWLCTGFCPTDL